MRNKLLKRRRVPKWRRFKQNSQIWPTVTLPLSLRINGLGVESGCVRSENGTRHSPKTEQTVVTSPQTRAKKPNTSNSYALKCAKGECSDETNDDPAGRVRGIQSADNGRAGAFDRNWQDDAEKALAHAQKAADNALYAAETGDEDAALDHYTEAFCFLEVAKKARLHGKG